MRRRVLFLAAIVLSSAAIACADSTAPAPRQIQPTKAHLDDECRSGYETGTGRCLDSI